MYLINCPLSAHVTFRADLELGFLAALPAQGDVHEKLFLSLNYLSVDGWSPNLNQGHQSELCVLWGVPGVSLKFRNYFIHYALGIMFHHSAVYVCGSTNTPVATYLHTHTRVHT